ncbi:hypothetical protein MDOR_00380 [Mycolicibacterium doricum]|uniref:Protein-glutamine gamma-glutamyltransferase-like C-terminal domain-containing protein n=1 Tax=Mycolicibacterium doricum TaxID=126673 RepID=A0A1X1SXP4_9MYCO|nr:DUF4129 domain-containing protein [Mycolicibacterium doricum]MCV7267682.1 DUF4129 domain-containing protein [Mycolicibacterium doricum]ORV35847.1 hypothetical protein AWC01_17590 [Mycolicibacterium doricum]BBZ05869.1 hypothetical protein MDOR_00380 [Mycolicibacterium doricum]
MPGADKATARAVTVMVLVLLAGVALRGHLPGAERDADEPTEGGPGPLIAVLIMLGMATAVVAVSVISKARQPVGRPSAAGDLARRRAGEGGQFTRRMALVLVGALLLWLLVVLTLMRISGWLDVAVDQPAAPEPDSDPGFSAGADAEQPPPAEPAGPTAVLGYFAAAAGLFVVLSVVGAMAGRRARRRPAAAVTTAVDDNGAAPVSRAESLARAAERGLIEIGDLSREPREAIIACYAAMERELGKSPGAMPQDSDTPTEVLARAVDRRLLHGESAAELVDLFEEARFSTHVMGEDHRDAAVRVLRLVLRELQDAA